MEPKKVFFLQGSPADSIFYLRTGRAKLTVVSPYGKGSHEVIKMEDPRCKIAAIEAEDPRCKNLLSGVEIEMEDPRCMSLLIRVVMEDPRCRIEAVKTEDPRCKNLHMMW